MGLFTGSWPHELSPLVLFLAPVVAVLSIILQIFLATGVYAEASHRSSQGRKLWFIGAGLWGFATFMGGVFVAATYWVLHHSTLGPVEPAQTDD